MAITERYVSSTAGGGGDGSEGSPWTFVEASNNSAPGDRINIKADGTYTLGSNLEIDIGADEVSPVHWRGYGTTIGDGTKPTIDVQTNRLGIGLNTTGHIIFDTFSITGDSALFPCLQTNDNGGVMVINVDVENTNTNSSDDGNLYEAAALFDSTIVNCHFKNNATNPDARVGRFVQGCMYNCVWEASNHGILHSVGFGEMTMSDCIVIGSGATDSYGSFVDGLDNAAAMSWKNITYHNFTHGIRFDTEYPSGNAPHDYINILLSTCSVGFQNDSIKDTGSMFVSPAFYNCTSDHNLGDQPIFNSISLTEDPFVDAASNNFALNEAPGGGALLKRQAFGTNDMGDGVNFNHMDIGGVQTQTRSETSAYVEGQILDYVLRDQADWAPGTVHAALFIEAPGDDASGTELSDPTDAGYARRPITFAPFASGSISNNNTVDFGPSTGAWREVTHFGIYDASSGGNLLFYGKFDDPVTLAVDRVLRITSGSLTLRMSL